MVVYFYEYNNSNCLLYFHTHTHTQTSLVFKQSCMGVVEFAVFFELEINFKKLLHKPVENRIENESTCWLAKRER